MCNLSSAGQACQGPLPVPLDIATGSFSAVFGYILCLACNLSWHRSGRICNPCSCSGARRQQHSGFREVNKSTAGGVAALLVHADVVYVGAYGYQGSRMRYKLLLTASSAGVVPSDHVVPGWCPRRDVHMLCVGRVCSTEHCTASSARGGNICARTAWPPCVPHQS